MQLMRDSSLDMTSNTEFALGYYVESEYASVSQRIPESSVNGYVSVIHSAPLTVTNLDFISSKVYHTSSDSISLVASRSFNIVLRSPNFPQSVSRVYKIIYRPSSR